MTMAEWEEYKVREVEIPENIRYKKMLIEDILEMQTKTSYTREVLQKMTISRLEHIYDYC